MDKDFFIFNKMIAKQKRIKELKELLASKEIRVTLWSDERGVSNCEVMFEQEDLRKVVKKRIEFIKKQFDDLSDEYPPKFRAQRRVAAKEVAKKEKF